MKRDKINHVFENLALYYHHSYCTDDGGSVLSHIGTTSQDGLRRNALHEAEYEPVLGFRTFRWVHRGYYSLLGSTSAIEGLGSVWAAQVIEAINERVPVGFRSALE
jgi:hypothetical protein